MKRRQLFYPDSKKSMRYWIAVAAVLILSFSGCANIGPKTVPRDRFDYNTAISDSWKEQTLLNIVKLRYADMPLFVEVASVVSGYTLEGSVNLGGNVSSQGGVNSDLLSLGTSGKYTDSAYHHLRPDYRPEVQRQLHDPHTSAGHPVSHAKRVAHRCNIPVDGGSGQWASQQHGRRRQPETRGSRLLPGSC